MKVEDFLRPDVWLSRTGGARYMQLRRRIEEGIRAGTLAPNSALPPERVVASITGLSRVTVRKAIHSLVQDGKIIQKQGSGSFVHGSHGGTRVQQSEAPLTSFTEEMSHRGRSSGCRVLEQGIFAPTDEETMVLGLSVGDRVARLVRLRLMDQQPLTIERAALPVDILPDPAAVTDTLYGHLQRRGLRPVRAIQRISAVNLSEAEGALLNVAPGTAALSIRRSAYLANGRPIEFSQSVARGDGYDFVAQLRCIDD